MRSLSLAAAVALASTMAGLSQSRASAAPPVAVSIEATPTQFFPVELGTWLA